MNEGQTRDVSVYTDKAIKHIESEEQRIEKINRASKTYGTIAKD